MNPAPWKQKNLPYIIAEIGSNHDGDKARALDLIVQAAEAGANAVKFQLFKAETLVVPNNPAYNTLQKAAIPHEWLPGLAEAALKAGVDFSVTPFDLEGVHQLTRVRPAFIKIASSDLTFFSLLRRIAQTGLPIIMSTGMANFSDIEKAIAELKKHNATEIGLMHCVSMYPPDFKDMNLLAITELSRRFNLVSGLSDHTPGSSMAVAACALGGLIFEKHVTDDKTRIGPDHSYALNFKEFETLVQDLNNTFAALGDGKKIAKGLEVNIKIKARRGLYASQDLKAGEVITEEKIIALRPTCELNAEEIDLILGKVTKKAIVAFSPILHSLIDNV